ncbi:MAG: DUF420 domain-containing protein [Bacteriovoracaceae bacterium]|nr:DUF420 domain-containing protein [Bacteriovoracaceae bacterium]
MLSQLPSINAGLNSLATFLLLLGYWAIKQNPQKKELHKFSMIAALAVSSLFLACYLYYHFHFPTKRFPDLGWIKTAYLTMLFTHIVLAVAMLPLIFLTFKRAFKADWIGHKKIARITYPIWLYVSFTGVLIYLMLYQWFNYELA